MILVYKVKSIDDVERSLEDGFSKYLIDILRSSIISKLTQEKLDVYKSYLLGTSIIKWNRKPHDINMVSVLDTILNNLSYRKSKVKHTYIIYIKDGMFPNTQTSIDTVVRFLDKGNEHYPGMHIFSKSFIECGNSLAQYWDMYIWQELHRAAVSEVVIIK